MLQMLKPSTELCIASEPKQMNGVFIADLLCQCLHAVFKCRVQGGAKTLRLLGEVQKCDEK